MAHYPIRRELQATSNQLLSQNVHDSCIFANELKNKKLLTIQLSLT